MTYSPLQGEDLYAVAAKLYTNDTYLGISDLISQNTIDLTTVDLYGTSLNYTAGLSRKKPVFPVDIVSNLIPAYTIRQFQSVYDLAIQLYGDFQKLGDLISAYPDLNSEITPGSVYNFQLQDNLIAEYFYQGIIVATSFNNTVYRRLLESGSYRLIEDSTYRLLE